MRRPCQRWLTTWLPLGMLLAAAGCATVPDAGEPAALYRPIEKRSVPRAAVKGVPPAPVQLTTVASNEVPVAPTEIPGRVLRSGDRIQVTIYAPPEPFASPHVVDEQGRINLPLIGPMVVAGKSCSEAQQLIEKKYIDEKYYKQITVVIVPPEGEYSVTGEVIRPGPYPLARNLTLSMALAKAGRYTEYADKSTIILIRGSSRTEINVDDIRKGKRPDIMIIPGDVIEVPRHWY